MTSQRWNTMPIERFAIADLVFGQQNVSIAGLFHAAAGLPPRHGDHYPKVALYTGQIHLVDGHHRVMVAMARGQTHIEARYMMVASAGTLASVGVALAAEAAETTESIGA